MRMHAGIFRIRRRFAQGRRWGKEAAPAAFAVPS